MKALLIAMALGQLRPAAPAPKAPTPVTKINLDGETEYGTSQGPTGVTVQATSRASFAGLIQVRENFRHEVLDSANELK
jgi:hypothetical protein